MAEPIKITIFRNQSVDEFTKGTAEKESKTEIGSSAAAVASIAMALLARAAVEAEASSPPDKQLDWFVRNTEILRSYMVRLIDEDVKCRGPLKKALCDQNDRKIEAARQVAVSICVEIVNMMGKALEIAEGLFPYTDSDSAAHVIESADLAFSSSLAAGRYILTMSAKSNDETYRYVMKRENELMMKD